MIIRRVIYSEESDSLEIEGAVKVGKKIKDTA